MTKWINKWTVTSRSSDRQYTVSRGDDGLWGCSCPAWKFARGGRKDCKHILEIKAELAVGPTVINGGERPEYTLAMVETPKVVDGKLLVPLLRMGPTSAHMEATIVAAMLKSGFGMDEIREIRNLTRSWTRGNVLALVNSMGPCAYPVEEASDV